MMSFWTQHVLGNQPGCLYISGSPGTGKTAMLNDVKRQMLNNNNKTKHHINIVMINCMSINEPKAIYTKLVTELKPTSSKKFPINADILVQVEYLLLNTKKDTLNVVILDEIDHLVTKDQDVLYKIFEWAFLPTSRLVLIGIANALNLTDLLLPRLRAKNCEPQLLNFNPYSANDISAIIKDRLYSLSSNESTKVLPLMQPIAVELCAKKVAARKGDLRQAFDLCQQAIELAQKEHKRNQNNNVLRDNNNNNSSTMDPKVTVRHISIVSQPVTGNSGKDKLAHLSLQQQIVMATLLILKQKKSRSTMADVRKEI
ncbi:P-loop containing nucleoside triphosphate hydrolase protein [Halteromyces radiatus]|uniref:P-loop containing nucleoside triphosphate hydrolase protein n=1 Tax=Halteromyces radiatus TaxID=101107 RepID=UPI00221E48D0|nr:P-loop containing nucleoside triphosphate hydrolase protein [Halteromyces radiatus]KAI8076342.1 P-loop containing nucleoside triphosphate hydrolase protein [Halteromyces radiatus]